MTDTTRHYTYSRLADRWDVSRAHLYNLVSKGILRPFYVGASPRIPAEQVDAIERGTRVAKVSP